MKNLSLSYSAENHQYLIVKCQHSFQKALAEMEEAIAVLENSDIDLAEKVTLTQEIVSQTIHQLEELERQTSTILGYNEEQEQRAA